jgi:hypothetical protein
MLLREYGSRINSRPVASASRDVTCDMRWAIARAVLGNQLPSTTHSESTQLELERAGSKIKVSVLCPAWVNTNILHAGRNRPADLAPIAPAKPTAIGQVFALA